MVLSEETGNYYATAKQASITSPFDEKTCQSLVGNKLPGKITRIISKPFDSQSKIPVRSSNLTTGGFVIPMGVGVKKMEAVSKASLTP